MSMQGDKYAREAALAPPRPRYYARSDSALMRALKRYANAVDEKAFQGTIPMLESDEAYEAWVAIDVELEAAKRLLLETIERRVNR